MGYLKIQIPPNTSAKVILPCDDINKIRITNGKANINEFYVYKGSICVKLGSGSYEFFCFI